MGQQVLPAIEVGRRVHYAAGYGDIDGDGLIVAVRNEKSDRTVDVILFDGRTLDGIWQHGIGSPGIGIKLLDRVHGPKLIEVAKRAAAKREADAVVAKAQAEDRFLRSEAARMIEHAPLFYWNGIKDAKGEKLQRCWYSTGGSVTGCPEGTIAIYARDHGRFSKLVREFFVVKNDTDTMIDYFDSDRIHVVPQHPLYPAVKAAADAAKTHSDRRIAKRAGGAA